MIRVIEKCFARELAAQGGWMAKLTEMIPSYGHSLIDDAALCRRIRTETAAALGLHNIAAV